MGIKKQKADRKAEMDLHYKEAVEEFARRLAAAYSGHLHRDRFVTCVTLEKRRRGK